MNELDILLDELDDTADKIDAKVQEVKKKAQVSRDEIQDLELFSVFNKEFVDAYFDLPYTIIPTGRKSNEWFLIVAKMFEMNVGYLEKSTKSHNIFVVNKFADYLGTVPKEFKKVFKFKPSLPLKLFDGMMLTGEEHQDTAWERYRKYLTQRKGTDKIRIKHGKQFDLLASMIDDGIMPFMSKPIAKSHMIEPIWILAHLNEKSRQDIIKRITMKFFTDAVKTMKKKGATGVFWATGVGKTLYGLELLATIRVENKPNLVISGTSAMLREQWKANLALIKTAAPVEVHAYQSWHKVKDKEFGLIIFDECHHLPANTFSKLATINADYRTGLSGTPYREDGRTDYIFVLTGWPIGLDWRVQIDLGLITEPDIVLYLARNYSQKRTKLGEILEETGKTLIYSFGTKNGLSLSKEFGIPFVYGNTPVKDRLAIIKESEQTIVSSVAGEGMSLRDLDRTITYDFLFGSRQEETQFFGRLLHSNKEGGKHLILMTDEEYEKYGKRIWGIEDKGFKVQVIRL